MAERLLVVDDEEGIRFLYREEFEECGYSVDVAASGEEALEKLDDGNDFDLIVLDIKMPGIDGVEVLREIKEKRKDLPVILSTAYPHYKHEFGTWACDAYVVKSSDLSELKETVKQVLAKRK
jgi:CheY-like chemotaxis protein